MADSEPGFVAEVDRLKELATTVEWSDSRFQGEVNVARRGPLRQKRPSRPIGRVVGRHGAQQTDWLRLPANLDSLRKKSADVSAQRPNLGAELQHCSAAP